MEELLTKKRMIDVLEHLDSDGRIIFVAGNGGNCTFNHIKESMTVRDPMDEKLIIYLKLSSVTD